MYDVWVDFNTMSDGIVRTLAAYASPTVALTLGRVVVVGDGEGTEATARVETAADGIVTLRVDTSTFTVDASIDADGLRAAQ